MILPDRDATLALAGVLQPLHWVYAAAATGHSEDARLRNSIDAILCREPATVLDVYGGKLENLGDGLRILQAVLRGRSQMDPLEQSLITRYAGQVLRLAGQVHNNRGLRDSLAEGLEKIPLPATDSDAAQDDDATPSIRGQVDGMAKLYMTTISPLRPRVMVSGQPVYLRNALLVADIRCHLLAALRSAVLWRQCGGRFWQLLLLRGFWQREAEKLVGELERAASKPADSI